MENKIMIEEAISTLEFDRDMILFNPSTGEDLTLDYVQACNPMNYKLYIADGIAIEALKKQIPLECNKSSCPGCGTYTPPSHTYCSHCGQRILRLEDKVLR